MDFYEHIQAEVDRLIPYALNSRLHSDAQVAQIAASIREFGFTNPILVDEEFNLIAGHGRVLAARKLGMDTLPAIVVTGMDDRRRRALIIADNKLALNSTWDDEALKVELQDLADEFGGLMGFSDEELADILGETEVTEGLTDEDDVPDVPEEPVTKLGDVWILGNHRLMCGDSTSIDAVETLMAGQKADMVFTDPPYGVEYQSNRRTKSKKFEVLENDGTFLDIAPIIESFSEGWVFVWTSWKVQNKWVDLFGGFGYPTNIVIWHKPGGGIGDLKRTFSSDYEVALVWHRGAELCGKRIGSVWTINKSGASTYVHPTQKPVALAIEAIDKTTNGDAVVLDLFGGSGSTLIACEKTNRHSRLMELDPKYCDVILQRYIDFTGKQAINEQTGLTYVEMAKEKA
jgi:DNA modification methylase